MSTRIADDKKIILGAFVLAAVLLTANLENKPYWSDEIFSLPKMDSPRIVLYQASFDVHPPLFFLLEFYWIRLFGNGETAARMLPALFGLLGMWFAYLIGKRTIPAKNLKLFALLIATSAFYLFYARMARYYSLTGCLSLAAVYFFLKMTAETSVKREIPFWVSALLLIYTDYSGFILILSLGLYYFWLNRKSPKTCLRFIAGGIAILILYLPWISNLLHGAQSGSAPYPVDKILTDREQFRLAGFIIYNTAQSALRAGYTAFDFTLGETVYPWNPLILTGIVGAALLFFTSFKSPQKIPGFWCFALGIPVASYLLLLVFYSKVFSASNFALVPSKILFLQPLWLLFLLKGEHRERLRMTGAALLLFFNFAALYNYHTGVQFLNPKYTVPWREIAAGIKTQSSPGDILVTDEEPLLHYLRGSKIDCYGLVDAEQYVTEHKPSFKVMLALRHRGEEAIFTEGLKVKDHFTRSYGQAEYQGYAELTGMQKKLWGKILGKDIEHYVMIFTFYVKE